MFKFKEERLEEDDRLGGGSFGQVYAYRKTPEEMKWVVKHLKVHSTEDLLRCLPEIVLGFSCDHPCIVPIKGYSIKLIKPKNRNQPDQSNRFQVHLKLPRMNGGNWAEEIKERKKENLYYSEKELVKHFYCLISAVDYLHNKRIFHGDIKANNVLLDENKNVKLSDVGGSKYVPDEDLSQTLSGANGTDRYKAPEIILHQKALEEYSSKDEEEKKKHPKENLLKKDALFMADLWSLGLVMIEACKLKRSAVTSHDTYQEIEDKLRNERNEVRQNYQDKLLDLIFGLLNLDPKERLKVSEVKLKLEENFKEILVERL